MRDLGDEIECILDTFIDNFGALRRWIEMSTRRWQETREAKGDRRGQDRDRKMGEGRVEAENNKTPRRPETYHYDCRKRLDRS